MGPCRHKLMAVHLGWSQLEQDIDCPGEDSRRRGPRTRPTGTPALKAEQKEAAKSTEIVQAARWEDQGGSGEEASIQCHQRLGCWTSALPPLQALSTVPSTSTLPFPAPPPHLQHQAFVFLVSHAPDLPDRPLPAAPPGRPGLRAGPRVQPEPRVRDSPGATQATRSGEHPGVGGGEVGSLRARGAEVRGGWEPFSPRAESQPTRPCAPFHFPTGPGTEAHILL